MDKMILSVSQLTRTIKILLEETLGEFSVKGEVSNFKHHTSGHRYFTLKDEGAQISCTMWKTRPLNFQLADGMKVIISGRLTVYPPRGQYQIDVATIVPLGQGDLYLAYEALKKKLSEAGYFTPERKKKLPDFITKIGIATSPTGAAIRDMITTIGRRFPIATLYIRHTVVQGDEAAPDIIRAIDILEATPAEVIIIGRGGGSIEDLWAFNMESVAEAIFRSSKPIISAVGHETDFTIADFVADVRAATPTAAAEIATPHPIWELNENIEFFRTSMSRSITDLIEERIDVVESLMGIKIIRRLLDKINMNKQETDDYESRIRKIVANNLKRYFDRILSLEAHCRSLNPLAPLRKGFALLKRRGDILSNSQSLKNNRIVEIIRENESAEARVTKILPKSLF